MEYWIDRLVRECGYTIIDAVTAVIDFARKGDYDGLDHYVNIAKDNYERRRKSVSVLQPESGCEPNG